MIERFSIQKNTTSWTPQLILQLQYEMKDLRTFLWGFAARIINLFVPIRKNYWIFGSDFGNSYREGAKYLLEYMQAEHPEYKCTFITQNPAVIQELKDKGITCYHNYSLKGLLSICSAERVFTCQYLNDIKFVYKKKGRTFFYLLHGMPYKKAFHALGGENKQKASLGMRLKSIMSKSLVIGYKMSDVSFISVTSDYLVQYINKDFNNEVDVKVLGMPRNDALFDQNRMKSEKWLDGLHDKFVVTYMPTHRGYGRGDLSPIPFEKRLDIQQWLIENNVVLLVKQHPNMIPKLKGTLKTDSIWDITKERIDPQVCIFHSDVLITDYSSVWMDYLILNRPLLFYFYDNFETEDAGVHYDIKDIKPGHFCYSEDELFDAIKKAKESSIDMRTAPDTVKLFHKYLDGDSCKRYFEEIIKHNG